MSEMGDDSDSQLSSSQTASYSTTTDNKSTARLFSCYLLVSQSPKPRSKNRTYIGFTVAPPRRLRQHNGDLSAGGARRTKGHRPWMMVCVIHGFASKTQGLQFEWAWQHPKRSVCLQNHLTRPDAMPLPSQKITSVNGRLQALAALTSVPPWSLCPLTLTVCAERETWDQHKIECVSFPKPLRVNFENLESFGSCETYNFRQRCDAVTPSGTTCLVCREVVERYGERAKRATHCPHCGQVVHVLCMATCRSEEADVQSPSFLPNYVECRKCNMRCHWSLIVRLSHALETDDD